MSKMHKGASNLIFERARELRINPTHAEELLWNHLRTKPLGFKFRRQHSYGLFILDFYCHAAKLVIEVDGLIHEKKDIKQNDIERQRSIEDDGLKVIRFTNYDVEQRLENVITRIAEYLKQVNHE